MKDQDTTTPQRQAGKRASALMLALSLIAAVLSLSATPAGAQSNNVIVEDGESIQAAIDAADPGTTIIVRGDHVENLWITKAGIRLVGQDATLSPEANPSPAGCSPDPSAPAPLVCVAPLSPDGPPAPADYLNGFTMKGFTTNGGVGDAIATVFVNNVSVHDNVINDPGCDGVFSIFGTNVRIYRNDVSGAGCNGINVQASTLVRINRNQVDGNDFSGVSLGDSSRVIIRRNIATNNCVGISAGNGDDFGFGIREEPFPGERLRITANIASNNTKTCPFGPEITLGLTGILVAGFNNVLIGYNTADGNAGPESTDTAAGILVGDFPNFETPPTPTTNVSVVANRAKGNSSAAGPLDLLLESESLKSVKWNHCDVSAPDASWCD